MTIYGIYEVSNYGKDKRLAVVSSKNKAINYIVTCLGELTRTGKAMSKTDNKLVSILKALNTKDICKYVFYKKCNGGYLIDGYYVKSIHVE